MRYPKIQPDLLQREIEHLSPAVARGRGDRNRQEKTELAALLYEAHVTHAYRSWGYKNLGSYAAKVLHLKQKTFAKYKTAGKTLRSMPVYDQLMVAVHNGHPRPRLPSVSELAAMPSLEKQLGHGHDIVSLLNEEGASLKAVKGLAHIQAYGAAKPEERDTLSSLDAFLQDLKRGHGELRAVIAGTKHVPHDQLHRRLTAIVEECRAILSAALVAEGKEEKG